MKLKERDKYGRKYDCYFTSQPQEAVKTSRVEPRNRQNTRILSTNTKLLKDKKGQNKTQILKFQVEVHVRGFGSALLAW